MKGAILKCLWVPSLGLSVQVLRLSGLKPSKAYLHPKITYLCKDLYKAIIIRIPLSDRFFRIFQALALQLFGFQAAVWGVGLWALG